MKQKRDVHLNLVDGWYDLGRLHDTLEGARAEAAGRGKAQSRRGTPRAERSGVARRSGSGSRRKPSSAPAEEAAVVGTKRLGFGVRRDGTYLDTPIARAPPCL